MRANCQACSALYAGARKTLADPVPVGSVRGDSVAQEYVWDTTASAWVLSGEYVYGLGVDNGNAARCLDEAALRHIARLSGGHHDGVTGAMATLWPRHGRLRHTARLHLGV